jgi:UDP-N-acetylmuramate dehydrogenase
MPEFEKTHSSSKISAAWLIEEADFKGYRTGDAGIYKEHSLIFVNHGEASAYHVMKLAKKIQMTVLKKFGIWLIPEPSIISSFEKIASSLMTPRTQIYTPRN